MNHLQAAAIVDRALSSILGRPATPAERALMQAVAWLESNYGRAPGQHAKWAASGLYTWGNIEKHRNEGEGCDEANGWYPGSDAGNPRCFKLDKTDDEAAKRYINTMISLGNSNSTDARTRAFAERSANIRAALSTGSPTALANAMVTPRSVAYYEANPDVYGKGLTNALAAIDKVVPRAATVVAVGKPQPLPASPVPSGEVSDSESGTYSRAVLDRKALALALHIIANGTATKTVLMSTLTMEFQRGHGGLKVDGIYGPYTSVALGNYVRHKFAKGE